MTRFTYRPHSIHASVRSIPLSLPGQQVSAPPVVRWDMARALAWQGGLRDRLAPVFSYAAAYAQDYIGPVLLFLKDNIQERIAWLRDLEARFGVAFLMAVKSTRLPELYALGQTYLSGFDVSNLNEYEALPNDLQGTRVFVTAPGFPDRPERFLARGNDLCFILDSADQYTQLQRVGGHLSFDFGVRLDSSVLLKRQGEVDKRAFAQPLWFHRRA